jgi:molecular chaperone DnaK
VKDAQAHAAEDKQRRASVETRNQADQQVYQTEKQLTELGDKLSADSKARLEAAIGRVKEALKGTNNDEIKSASDALMQVWHGLAGELYKQASSQAGPETGPETGPEAGPQPGPDAQEPKAGKGKAVDADFEVVN